jgi:hypothetical protein
LFLDWCSFRCGLDSLFSRRCLVVIAEPEVSLGDNRLVHKDILLS